MGSGLKLDRPTLWIQARASQRFLRAHEILLL